uniref:ParD-like antitoxin of type II toxin-antitoxin system n=2 Tax=unclassified Candidatus Kentrum TaxID=2643149 RepID=A0A451AX48_9GAMM|nr:MAG: ParD-like antitoxin of type II toxin-antitoxin system [Candidatus Kentron sp. LPFa]VFK62518.1 MAG: ParD-like antitoxin of type II toxin-antitoxin system [Candidatus Kentron sp. UNK]VFK70552.1 MAG: ParD-like antitoxin of type II toxin-antitoxin system [Candidatus Kentron sp. UNK]
MLQVAEFSKELIASAEIHAAMHRRSIPGQIEYWALIGRSAVENPDLPPSFISNTLLAKTEAEAGDVEEYTFG